MGLEPGSQNRKPVPGKALLPTDDFLGHGEQGQRGQGGQDLGLHHPVPAATQPWTPRLSWASTMGGGGPTFWGLPPSWDTGQWAGHTGGKAGDQG